MTKQEAKEQGKCMKCPTYDKKIGKCESISGHGNSCVREDIKKGIEESLKKNREKEKSCIRYKVEPCVSDYAVRDTRNNELVTICNSKRNADLIAAILEKDDHCSDGWVVWRAPGSSYTFTDDDYYKVAAQYSTRTVYGIEEVLENGEPCRNFVPGVIVRHFKGNLYEIKDIVKHSESGELLVIYQALYSVAVNQLIPESVALGERQTFARPLTMFSEEVDRQKYPHAGQRYRMEIVRFKDVRKGEES